MSGTIYYINVEKRKRNTAGAKAPADIAKICEMRKFTAFCMPVFPSNRQKVYQKLWLLVVTTFYWEKLRRKVKKGDVIIYQHPMYGNRVIKKMLPKIKEKGCKLIALIHDLESLRGGIQDVITTSNKTNKLSDNLLRQFDSIICHNEHMKAYLVSQGFDKERLVSLDIFDYLSEVDRKQPSKSEKPSIAIAGNLAIGKCRYIYDICDDNHNQNLIVNLYGNNYQEQGTSNNLIWHGSFKPEELSKYLVGDFGLVWDGNSAETCAGNTGEYLKYNNPHKTSLYLSAGMPVVVWSKAAIADFVLENHCGIVVDSLYELEPAIANVTVEEYQKMCQHAAEISERLKSGFYFNAAVDVAIAKCLG